MAKENVQKFIEKINNDQELRQQIEAKMDGVEDVDAIAEVLAAFSEKAGLPFTANEYKLASQKLQEGDLDKVAGGTFAEVNDFLSLGKEIEQRLKEAGASWWFRNRIRCWDTTFKKLGNDAEISGKLFGICSKNNTYRCMQTGKMILHSEVIDFIKTGKKSWL